MNILRHSITTKLLLLFLSLGISTLLIIGSYSFYSARRAIIQRTVEQLISVRTFKKQQIEDFFEVRMKSLYMLRTAGRLTPASSFSLPFNDFPGMYIVRQKLFQPLHVYGFDTLSPVISQNINQMVNKIGQDTTIRISDLFYKSPNDSVPVFLLGCNAGSKFPDENEYIIAEVPATNISRILLHENSKSGLGNSGEAYLVGSDYLMRSESRFFRGSVLKIPVMSESARKAITGITGTDISYDYRGVQVFSAYEPLGIRGLNWVILAEIDYEEAMIPVTGLRNDILLVSLVISLLILGFARLISKMVTQPIIRMKNAAAELGRGNFDQKVKVNSEDEIGLLADTFNNMSDQLKEERKNRLIALYDGQEMERKRISRELHDGLGQKLIGSKLQIENCDENDHQCLRKTLTGTKLQLHAIVEELRRISNDLMPAALVELGPEAALKNLCEQVSLQSQIVVECDIALSGIPDDQTSVYLFRICQEGMQNVIKHAGAERISVHLTETRDLLILIIEDNGKGFDPGSSFGGSGLVNMKERSLLLGGTFTIESEPGHGTTIRVKIPKTRPWVQ